MAYTDVRKKNLFWQVVCWPYTSTFDIFKLTGIMCHIGAVLFTLYQCLSSTRVSVSTSIAIGGVALMLYMTVWAVGRGYETHQRRRVHPRSPHIDGNP